MKHLSGSLLLLSLMLTAHPAAARAETLSAGRRPRPAELFSTPEIESGFHHLYGLHFSEARETFAAWKAENPGNPLGDVSMASSYLFEEFYQQGVLTSDFFLNDKRLLGGIEGKPDAARAQAFLAANHRARELALERLKVDAGDPVALYALTLSAGMESNYASILAKKNLESVHWLKEADHYAKALLKVQPDAQDAWLALGASDYIIGCLPGPKKFFLSLGGVHGDRKAGLEELRRTSEAGHYLRPYARLLLALAALREKQEDIAREQFSALAMEFPENPLFTRELARLNH